MVLFGHNESMLRSCFVSLSFVFFGFYAIAANPQQTFAEQFQSHRITFPSSDSPLLANSPGRYPGTLSFLFSTILGWTPEGEGKELSPSCALAIWEQRLSDSRLSHSVALQGGLIQKYFQECGREIETGKDGRLSNFTHMMGMRLDPQEHPFLRRVVINLPGNVKLKGLLGLKGDMKRRPMVIVRLGIFSSIEDFLPERAWMMMLFEQSPFNVLFLENMSSSDFIANNSQFSFGGYDEGIQNIQVARLLKNSDEPLSRIVDSLHMFGVSLGGHGTLFASLLNKYNSSPSHPLINSFTAMCPVVHLRPSMEGLTQSGSRAAFIDVWSRQRLKGLEDKLPGVAEAASFSYLSKVISEIARTYHGALSYVSTVKLPPGMNDSSDFWAVNDFWKYYSKVEQPVLIYATVQDPAVPYAANSQQFVNKKLKIESKNIRVIELSEGVHCTLPVAYDWRVIAGLLQAYILSHSPDFRMQESHLSIELSDEEWKGFVDKSSKVRFSVDEPGKKSGFVAIEISVTNSRGDKKTMNLSLPLSQFDFRFLNEKLSSSEREMIVRWINQNLKLSLKHEHNLSSLEATWMVAQ